MNEKQKKMIQKLNDEQLNDLNKSWIELSKIWIFVGIIFVIIILIIIFLNK